MSDIAYTQNNTDQGELKIQVTARRSNRPITNARVREFDTLKSKKVPQSLEIGLFFCQIFIFII